MNDLKKRILDVMGTVFEINPSEIVESSGPGSIEKWDSLRHMTLVVALEEEFNIRFRDEMIEQLINFKLIEIFLRELLKTEK